MASNGNKDSKDISGGGGKDDGDDLKKIPFSKSSTSKTASSESPKSEKDINNNDTRKSPVKPVGKMNAAANLHTFRNNGGGDDDDDDGDDSSDGSFLNNIRPKTSNNDTSSLNDGAESSTIKSRNDNNWDESNGDDGPAPGAYEVEGRAVGSLPEWGRRITPPETSQESNRSVRFTDETTRSSGTNNPHRTLRGWLSSMRLDQSTGREDSGIITATSVSDAVPIVFPDQIRTSIEIELEQKQEKRRHAIKWSASIALVIAATFLVTYFVINKQGKTSSAAPGFCDENKNDPYVQCNCDDDDEITKKSFFTKSSTMEDYECWYTFLKDELGLEINNDTSCEANNLALWWLAKGVSRKIENKTEILFWKDNKNETCTHLITDCISEPYCNYPPGSKLLRERFFELHALAVLYYSLNGKDWINTTGWLNMKDVCEWHGVRCLGDGRYEKMSSLDLENNNLTGPFPKEMSRLTHLRNLNLQSNHITGSMPHDFWSNMANIRLVKLANNAINGTLPEAVDVHEIAKKKLDKFCQAYQNYYNIAEVYDKGNATEDDFCRNYYNTTEVSDKGDATEDYDKCNKTIATIEQHGVNIANICDDLKNTALDVFNSSLNFLYDSATYTKFLGDDDIFKIHYFDISSNLLEGKVPIGFSYYPNLHHFDISNNSLSEMTWAKDNITNETIFPRLDVLRIGRNQFHGPIPWELIENVGDLEELDLSHNQFNGTIPSLIGNMLELEELDLSHNQFNGPIPPAIGNLSELEELDLSHNQFNGPVPPAIGNLSELEELDLSHNQFNGTIPSAIGDMSELRILDLQDNKLLTGSIPTEMKELRHLEELYLNGTNLTDDVSYEFCDEIGYYMSSFVVDCDNIACKCCSTCNTGKRYGIYHNRDLMLKLLHSP